MLEFRGFHRLRRNVATRTVGALAIWAAAGGSARATIENFVWVPHRSGSIVRFDLGGARQKLGVEPPSATGIAIGADGTAFVAGAAGIHVIDSRGKVVGLVSLPFGARGVAVGAEGDLWITTGAAGRTLERRTRDGDLVLEIRGFDDPTGVAADASGGAYVVDSRRRRLARVSPRGEVIFAVPGGDCDGAIALDAAGNACVADACGARALLRYSPDGALVARQEVPALSIGAIAVDGLGQAWAAHPGDRAVTVFAADGSLRRTVALGDSPHDVAVDGTGVVWVLGGAHGVVERFDPATLEPLPPLASGLVPTARGDATGFTLARSTLPGADFDGDAWSNYEEIAAGTNPFSRSSRPYAWLAGNVNSGAGRPADVLFVNDSPGDGRRSLSLVGWEPFSIYVDAPPAARGPAEFVLWAREGTDLPAAPVELPRRIGALAFRPTAPHTVALAASFVPPPRIGPPLLATGTAPVIVVRRPRGLGRPAAFTLQGLIEDPGASGPGLSVTNGVVVRVH